MENKTMDRYDLAIILKQSDLNVRGVAAAMENLSAGSYFCMLSELIDHAPVFSGALRKLIARDGDRNAYKDLSRMYAMLNNLGYEKHATDFDGMFDSYDRGHSRLTSTYAKKIIDDFYGLCTVITDSRISQPPEAPGADPNEVSLKDWIERLYTEPRKTTAAGQKPVILTVDDSPVVLKSVSSYLANDYKVYMLAKPYMLEKVLGQVKPDLFLLDYNMPVLNGFDLIPIIRGHADFKDTPIIFLTSEGTLDNVSGAIKLGACDFIAKPVQPSILRERLGKHIGKGSETRESAS